MTKNIDKEMVDLFRTKAELVSATVAEVADMDAALQYAVELCDSKEACQLLLSGCEENLSGGAEALCETIAQKTICAPELPKKQFDQLKKLSDEKGFNCIAKGMRENLGGIDIGFTRVNLGIAETGSLVLNSCKEEVRIATMLAEIHVAVLKKSDIMADAFAVSDYLKKEMGKEADYHAFITGASRTADIERVLALGVHGPLELHILLLEG